MGIINGPGPLHVPRLEAVVSRLVQESEVDTECLVDGGQESGYLPIVPRCVMATFLRASSEYEGW